MRLASMIIVALLAGCLGPVHSNDSLRTDGSRIVETDAEPRHPANASADPDKSQSDPDPAADPAQQAGSNSNKTAPEPPTPMHWAGSMGWVAIPAAGPWSECEAPLTGCNGPFFSIDGTFDLEATLSWDLPTNDLDLYLCRWSDLQCDEVSRDGINNDTDLLTTRQVLRHADLPAGHYRLWIVPQHGINMEYELDAVFR